jgi:hypothetical protein
MPQYIALKTFRSSEYGGLNAGMTYTLPERYARDLLRNNLVRPVGERQAPRNAAIPEAPETKWEDLAAQQAAGPAPLSSASLPAPRSPKRTARTSKAAPK